MQRQRSRGDVHVKEGPVKEERVKEGRVTMGRRKLATLLHYSNSRRSMGIKRLIWPR
jgi:hypothetical protein